MKLGGGQIGFFLLQEIYIIVPSAKTPFPAALSNPVLYKTPFPVPEVREVGETRSATAEKATGEVTTGGQEVSPGRSWEHRGVI